MTTEKAIKDIQFIKAGYENLMENDPERLMAVGEGISCEAEVKTKGDLYAHFVESLTMAEAALEELRLYNMGKMCLIPADIYEKQCKELDELKEKNTAKKARRICWCSKCDSYNQAWAGRMRVAPYDTVYCWHCGQAHRLAAE